MEGFKKQLIAQSSVRFMSVGDLTVGRTYLITKMCNQETQYGRTTSLLRHKTNNFSRPTIRPVWRAITTPITKRTHLQKCVLNNYIPSLWSVKNTPTKQKQLGKGVAFTRHTNKLQTISTGIDRSEGIYTGAFLRDTSLQFFSLSTTVNYRNTKPSSR